ncbi:hypothetical protein [Sediminibacillus albus]|uniref:STAS domain-containing protein n=1 Tax=Sediminibacillus albus TaxID=407036 RepID=A0A1G8WJJ8_9BACI|nr:hypothetical protein [Sediminibacillus albus]SDJ78484.1 hypothetical protein SAMN05216243_0843 [Sediminibacillus albus]
MTKYTINVVSSSKTIEMEVKGSFSSEDVKNFVTDYQKKVNSIDASSYTLDVDCTSMDLLTKDMVPSLENSFKMYNESGFNKVVFTIKKNPVLKMQLNRIAKSAGLTNSEVAEVA